ncbi:cupin (plasmid) [Paraburkholderia terrae]|uniref:Cupin n=1 Tax=Paraburkholderia terrae TaxID=311230 RepID=A0ABN6JZD1_9BURK|nr:cupin domain-containing protein [Paraburkholderia terrae]BCZ85424.1 cupin [Paraburkholderia terrae]
MNAPRFFSTAIIALSTTLISTTGFAEGDKSLHETITPAFVEALPKLAGKTITAIVVDYPPGASSIPHRHGQAFVIGYVLQGEIRSQINNGESRVYHAGEHWTEAPGVHHTVSENVSKSAPAKLLAIFVADSKDKDLVIWDKK